ncbi:hypothetical protein [Halogeometricum limi]|uniref:Uncharacterized protein n=1 Tax=Halogeometricum limi TaxID=555875 RepID=A0A1I6GLG2_9EURY|nr:hypothetical protein [Halogeometricum limi]SFR43043.1 hypothetical protein SAMN04488124_1228 [Halogeometricum limi]
MRTKLAVGVGLLVAVGGVASAVTTGAGPAELLMWTVVALIPAAIVALGGVPSGYSSVDDDREEPTDS